MSEAREQILANVRRALGRDGGDAERKAAVESRIAAHDRNLVPKRALLDQPAQVRLFVEMAEKAAATIAQVADPGEVPEAVSAYLTRFNLPHKIKLAPDPALTGLPWSKRPLLKMEAGVATPNDTASVTPAFAGIAETGTLMLISSPATPTTLNFLPENHIVILCERQIVGPFEDAWDRVRAAQNDGAWPRTVNFITGPSRSADIEQQLQMGAHGPRRLHIILVAENRDAQSEG